MTITKQEMEDVLRDAAKRGYFQGGGPSSSSPSSPSSNPSNPADNPAFTQLGKVLTAAGIEVYDGFKKVANQSYTIADASKSVATIFSTMGGPLGSAAAAAVGDLGKYGQESVDKWREVSKFGASFGNDAIGFRAGAAQTRMSFEEYTQFLSKNKDSLMGLGGSVTESARSFNKFSKDFMDTGVSDKMRAMGYTTEELNNVLVGTMASQRLVNLNDEASKKVAMQSAESLATQMDAVAKITGKSRQEQEDAMKTRATDAQYQAMEKLSLMELTGKDRAIRAAAIESMKTSAHALGPAVEGVVKEMATGGVRSKEAGEMMAALGPAGKQLQDAVNASKNARTEQDKDRAAQLMKDAEAAVIAQQNTKGFLQGQMLGIGAFKTSAESTMAYSKTMDATLKEMNVARADAKETLLDLANPADAKKVKEYMDQRVKNEQAGVDKDGVNKNKGAEVTDAIVKFESRAADAGAAINANLVAPLNEALGSNIRAYNEKHKGDELFGNVKDGKSARARVEAPIGAFSTSVLGLGPNQAAQTKTVTDKSTGEKHRVPPELAASKQRDALVGTVTKLGEMGVDVLNITGKVNGLGTPRSKGSLGETGNLFENFGQGTLAMLHGKESVVTEDQMKNLVKGSQGISLENIANNFKTSISAAPSMSGLGQNKDASQYLPSMSSLQKSSVPQSRAELEMTAMGMTPPNTNTEAEGAGATKEKSISDLDDKLDQLNKHMMQLVAISSQTAENSGKQIKATKGLGGNLFA